jgi:amino acid adenylation domain-containing protein
MSQSDLINNIGKPFDNTSAFVLEPDSNTILPRGAVGELCFGGYQVFQGYLNRPDLTEAKIINHPTYGRIYRSGDLGILLDDDSILFSGRLDDQVKVRGQRIELGEISSTVLDQPCARDCATLLLQRSQDSETLVTFWVPTVSTSTFFEVLDVPKFHTDLLALFTALSHRLPTYMVPSHLVPISRLPMTTQGKIDKRLLQQCFDTLSDEQLDLASHSSDDLGETTIIDEWEAQVAQVLAATLGISFDNIKRNSSFFNIGLDSVSGIGFSNRLRKANLGDFAISEIMKNATIAHLAALKDTHVTSRPKLQEPAVSAELAIGPDEILRIRNSYAERNTPISKIRPCTPLQEAMLSSVQSTPETSYSNMMAFSVTGDLPRLQESWALMVRRHEILRTSFVATSESPYAFTQVVSEDASLQWGSMNWSSGAHEHANKVVADLLHDNKPPVWLAIAKAEESTKFLFCCHHAVYDGTAVQVLLREVQEVYHQQTLPPPVSFDAYIRSMLSQNLEEADNFWTASFQGFEPTAFPDLTGKTHKEPHICSSLQQGLRLPLSEVREACQNASVTLLSAIHATWGKLLYFYTGTSDICFGNVVSGRALPGYDLERLVAPCFNTLPVRIHFDPSKQNIALSDQAHACNVESFAYQLTPLRRIQNIALKDGGRLFDTLIILQQPAEPLDSTIWTLEEDRGNMDLPLVCEISQNEVEDRLDLTLHYHSTIISEKEAKIVAETFDSTLATIIDHPHAAASDILDLPRSLQSESNAGIDIPDPKEQYLHLGFEKNVQANPDATALDFLHPDGTRTMWSYQALNDKANDIAHALIDHGVKLEQIIPVHMPKCPIFYASILGVLKAGAAFAPVHPGLPEERRRTMLEDLKADIVMCTSDSTLPSNGDGFRIVDVGAVNSSTPFSSTVQGLSSANLAYCIFTSGSTGVPKAVSMEHRAPMQTIECSKSLVPWTKSSRLLQYAATTFDMCYYDCFLAWTFGFTLCAAEQDMMLNELPKIINTLDADLLDLTPSVAATLTRSDVSNIKWLYCIGEAMTPDIVADWEGACVNSYGPSEAAFCTTIFPVSKKVKPSVIGAPFSSTSFAVFPELRDHPLPLLSIGELYIGGAQLARGYFNRPELTAEKFVTKSGQKFYRSGDVVRMLSDGNFEFIGRADDQVKIRGLRVELGEINNTLRGSHDEITAVVTQILKKDTVAKEQLVAFLVTRQPSDDDQREELRNLLRHAAKHRLPSYMVPQFFIFVERIPRSPAGKVDKKALLKIFQLSEDASTLPNGISEFVTEHPWTTLQSQIRSVFARLSKSPTEDVSPTTTIYQLGLDSISAVQIATALRREGQKVNATDVMRYLTCVDLATYLEEDAAREQPATELFDLDAFDRKYRPEVLASCKVTDECIAAIRPCTPLQRGMLSQMLAKEGAVYVNYLRLELDLGIDLDSLKKAWEKVTAGHEMLRTGFVHLNEKDHRFGMIEYMRDAIDIPWNAVRESDTIETPEVWLERLQRSAASNLHKPLWNVRVGCKDNIKYLDLAIFHALFDAQSLQSILRDVITAYKGGDLQPSVDINGVVNGILQRSIGYSDQAKEFWAQMGKQIIPCRFPNLAPLRYDPQPPMICSQQSKRSFREIQEACRKSNTTLQAVGIASWLSLISAYTGEPMAACGVVLSGRSFEEAENANFPCINTVPFAHAISEDPEYMLNAVTSLIAEVQQHQHVPLNDIQKLMGYPNEALFDTIFAYQKLPVHEDKDALWRIVDEKATIEYHVSIELEPNGDHLEYRLTVMPHAIPREQATLILEQLDELVECFVFASENVKTFDSSLYSITPPKERTLPSEAHLLHDFVELTAKQHPRRTALEFAKSIHNGDYSAQRWTYSELDAEGSRIANLLISNGVQPGDLVGVCFDKCPQASFAMLGVLKAGAAFVAIDPGAPAARQAFIIQDSGATAVLSMSTQSAGFAKDVNLPVLNLDEITTSALPDTKPSLAREISPQDRSYCLYTSGTTGTPKGCELTHENAVQALLSFQRLFAGHWDAESRWLQFASFHFDVSVLEQYWSWSVGICVVSAPRDVIFEDIANSINTLGITHIDLTPSLAQILHPDEVPSLCKGVFITGGESLKQEILDVWGPKGVIYNGYGPTEATIGCTMYPRVPANGKPSNIGPQFDNVGSFVLRPGSDIPVLRGGVGELCVSGKLVGKGYLNRDELTGKSFPYLDRFEERVYRTGDLVRILHDGTFEFLGRADDQVKLRGQRLEIGEINSVIRQSDKYISDVATLVLKHPRQQKEQLVAFVVQGRTNSDPGVMLNSTSEMVGARDACHDKLPPYMVPTHFVPLSSLPLNINNKADAKKLKAIYEELSAADLQRLSATSGEREDSWSSLETKLRTVLTGELGVAEDAIGKENSFFELGMDSISVIGVVRALKKANISEVSPSLIMKHSTIRRLAKALSAEGAFATDRASVLAAQQAITAMQHRHRRAVARSIAVDTTDIEALAPCTPLQHGMIAKSLESEERLYFNTFEFDLRDNIDIDRLRAAWEGVYASTQILRTVFVNTEEGYVQAVLRRTELPWKVETATVDKDPASLRRAWLQSNQNDFTRPFELVCLLSPEKQSLVVHIFHGLYDGISIELVFKAVWSAFNGRHTANDAPPFQSALAYGPSRIVGGAKTFWQSHFADDLTKPRISTSSISASKSIKVTRELRTLDTLESIRRKLNVTAQAIAQACWLSVLQEHRQGNVTTGVVVSGRSIDLEGADRIIGPMFNTIPYQHQSYQSESWASIIKRVHDFNVAVHPYQHTPLRDIIKWCKIDTSQPLFDNLFVYQVAQDDEDWASNEAWQVRDGDADADYPMALEVEQRPHGVWRLTLVTQSNAYDEKTSQELLKRFENALYEALKDPEMMVKTSIEVKSMEDVSTGSENITADSEGLTTTFEWTHEANEIRKILAELTNVEVDDIGEGTSILELGLDSIDAIKLSSKLKKHNVNLPVSGIMRGLTIPKMLPYVTKTMNTTDEQGSVDEGLKIRKDELRDCLERQNINTCQIEDILPLTPLQEAMVAEMVVSEFTRYYNFDVMELERETDIDRLRDSWTQVVRASPILRTFFVEIEDPAIIGSFAQIIRAEPHNFWSATIVEDVPDFPTLFEQVRKDARQTFSSEPPFYVQLVKSSDRSYLVLSIAHALYDGWSLGLIHADVKRAYEGGLVPRPDYQPTLSEILKTSGADASTFWSDYLFEAKPSTFVERSTPELSSQTVHRLEQSSTMKIATMTEFAKKSNISLQTLGQSVFAIVLASYVRSLDVIFGSVLSGRDDETTSQLLFPTMNTVAIRTILHGSRLELLRHVQDSFTNVKQWQHFPLRKALALAGTSARLFESLFIYQKSVRSSEEEGAQLYKSIEGHSDVEYPVCVEMEVVHEQLTWRCAVKDEVFNEAGSKALLSRLDEVLREVVERPDRPVIDFMSQGISLCGLSPFKERTQKSESKNTEAAVRQSDQPQAETVRAVRQVLAFVSGTPEDEITDDMTIFHIGLDSISAIKVSSLLRRKGVILSVGEMLRAGSVSRMAQIIDARSNQHGEGGQDDASSIKEALNGLDLEALRYNANMEGMNIDDLNEVHMLPATAGQIYMLSMWLNTAGSNFYPEFTYKLTGAITFEVLQAAWRDLVEANPILRTNFVATQDQRVPYVQLLRKETGAAVSIAELTGENVDKFARTGTWQPWAHLYAAQSQNGWTLKLKIHHALYDGVSLPTLMQQLQDMCNGSTVPASENAFEGFIAKSSTQLALSTRKSFWTHYLDSVTKHHFLQPTSPVTKTEIFAPALLPTKPLEDVARHNGISIQALFLATYANLYAKLTHTHRDGDVVLGLYLANRSLSIAGIETAAIPTVNLLPLRVRTPLTQSTLDAAKQIQRDIQNISELAHASASLHEIKTWTGVTVDSFVNFLTLPSTEEHTEGSDGVKIMPENAWTEAQSHVVEHDVLQDENFLQKFRCKEVNEAYLVSPCLPLLH